MGPMAESIESRDRRDGWTPGPAIVLGDGDAWHLPAIDAGLIPSLPRLIPAAESVRMIGERWQETGELDPALRSILAGYLVESLDAQYRTGRMALMKLTRPALADPKRRAILADHIASVRTYAARRGLISTALILTN